VPDKYKDRIGFGPVKETFFAYGGWWEKAAGVHNDHNFCMNGLLAAGQTPHPALFAAKYVQRNVEVLPVDPAAGVFKIRNRFDFTTLGKNVSSHWKIEAGGRPIREGSFPTLGIAPHSGQVVTVPMPKDFPTLGNDVFITFEFRAKNNYHPLVAEDHLLAWDQFELSLNAAAVSTDSKTMAPVSYTDTGEMISVTGQNFSVEFSKTSGCMTSFVYDGKPLIRQGGQVDFWRPITDNDRPLLNHDELNMVWSEAGKKAKPSSVTVESVNPSEVRVQAEIPVPWIGGQVTSTYTVCGNGDVSVSTVFDFSKTDKRVHEPPAAGLKWVIPGQRDTMTWFGKGPYATYCDRDYAPVGLYSGSVDEQWIDYSRPQENGNKTGVRWMALTDKGGNGLLVVAEGDPLSMNARFYDEQTIEGAAYSFEMERSEDIHLNIDARQSGVGGVDSWGTPPLPAYRLSGKFYRYALRFRPLSRWRDVSGESFEPKEAGGE
jgi:beta-galactosidase